MCGFDHFLCIVGFILGDCLSGYLIFERFLSFGFFKFMGKIKMDSVLLPYSRLVFLFFFLHFEIFLSLTAFSIDSMFFLFVLTRFMFWSSCYLGIFRIWEISITKLLFLLIFLLSIVREIFTLVVCENIYIVFYHYFPQCSWWLMILISI